MSTPATHPETVKKPAACPPPIPGLRVRAGSGGSAPPTMRLLAGRYRLDALIGRGAMGDVFRAFDLTTHSSCAIKTLNPLALRDEDDYDRFTNEAAVMSQLFHPNIVGVRSFHRDDDGLLFLVMELLEGVDLNALLEEKGRLSLERTQRIIRQVASALHAAHSIGIVHRDIKPRNIFLANGKIGDQASDMVKVVDFGLSKVRSTAQQHTALGIILGTIGYLAPEGTLGRSTELDERTDQWALAVTAFEMLTDRLPFQDEDTVKLLLKIRQAEAPSLLAFRPDLPLHVAQAVARALSKRKEDRFPSILEFMRAFCGLNERTSRTSSEGRDRRAAPTDVTQVMQVPEALRLASCPPLSEVKDWSADALPVAANPPKLAASAMSDPPLVDETQPISAAVLDDLVRQSCVPETIATATGSADYSLQFSSSGGRNLDEKQTAPMPPILAPIQRPRASWGQRLMLGLGACLGLTLMAQVLGAPARPPSERVGKQSAAKAERPESAVATQRPPTTSGRTTELPESKSSKPAAEPARKRNTPPLRGLEEMPDTQPRSSAAART